MHDPSLSNSGSRVAISPLKTPSGPPRSPAAANLISTFAPSSNGRASTSLQSRSSSRSMNAMSGSMSVVAGPCAVGASAMSGSSGCAVDDDARRPRRGSGLAAHAVASLGTLQRRAAAQAQRVVDAVGLGDHAPARRVAVGAVGDRWQRVAVVDDVDAEAGLRARRRVLALLGAVGRLRRGLAPA